MTAGLASWLRRAMREVMVCLGHHRRPVLSEHGDRPFASRKAEWVEEEEAISADLKRKRREKRGLEGKSACQKVFVLVTDVAVVGTGKI